MDDYDERTAKLAAMLHKTGLAPSKSLALEMAKNISRTEREVTKDFDAKKEDFLRRSEEKTPGTGDGDSSQCSEQALEERSKEALEGCEECRGETPEQAVASDLGLEPDKPLKQLYEEQAPRKSAEQEEEPPESKVDLHEIFKN